MVNLEAGRGGGGPPGGEYQVFLRFRGTDTPYGITECICHAFVDAGIRVDRKEAEHCVGEVIVGELLRSIDDSILYTPTFSRNHATSKWCLRELAGLLPFFDLKPAVVKLKTRFYSDALLEHEKKFPEEVKARQKALVEVNEIKGWNLQKDEGQGQLINLVVDEVLDKLKIKHKPVTEHLVGVIGLVEEVMKLLGINSGDVQLIRIHGMGGMGKTAAAKVVFNQPCSYFGKRCSFLEDIRKESTKDGLVKLQEKLLLDVANSRAIERILDSDYAMRMTREIAYEYIHLLGCP